MSSTRPVAVRSQATSPGWIGPPVFTWAPSTVNKESTTSPRSMANGTLQR